jgi:hypothetical protein
MAEPVSGRVTGLAVDPSDPSRPDDTFVFNLTPGPDDNKGDTSIITDYRAGDSLTDQGDAGIIIIGGFTGGVFVGSGDLEGRPTESLLPAVQSPNDGDAVGLPYIEYPGAPDGFAQTQPFRPGSYAESRSVARMSEAKSGTILSGNPRMSLRSSGLRTTPYELLPRPASHEHTAAGITPNSPAIKTPSPKMSRSPPVPSAIQAPSIVTG